MIIVAAFARASADGQLFRKRQEENRKYDALRDESFGQAHRQSFVALLTS
jgi:hypothetical protein